MIFSTRVYNKIDSKNAKRIKYNYTRSANKVRDGSEKMTQKRRKKGFLRNEKIFNENFTWSFVLTSSFCWCYHSSKKERIESHMKVRTKINRDALLLCFVLLPNRRELFPLFFLFFRGFWVVLKKFHCRWERERNGEKESSWVAVCGFVIEFYEQKSWARRWAEFMSDARWAIGGKCPEIWSGSESCSTSEEIFRKIFAQLLVVGSCDAS